MKCSWTIALAGMTRTARLSPKAISGLESNDVRSVDFRQVNEALLSSEKV